MYLMENPAEGARMEKRDVDEALHHFDLSLIRPGDCVLDVGCASGLLTRLLAERVAPGTATGVDLSADRIAQARLRASEQALSNIAFEVADVTALPFADASFDVSFSRYTFEYLRQPREALAEMKRVTRPGGRVVVADLDGNGFFHDPIPDSIQADLERLRVVLTRAGFDPFIGRKLYHLFYHQGFRHIKVDVLPHHLIAGVATEAQLENWNLKFQTIRPIGRKAFASAELYDQFVESCLELLKKPDVLTYSVTFLVSGVV